MFYVYGLFIFVALLCSVVQVYHCLSILVEDNIGLFSVWNQCKQCYHEHMYAFSGEHMYRVPLGTYLGLELLGHTDQL